MIVEDIKPFLSTSTIVEAKYMGLDFELTYIPVYGIGL